MAVFLAAALACGMTAEAALGVAMARGSFRLDNAVVSGNATLFDGSVIETSQAASELQLPAARIELAAGSRATVYRDRLVLAGGEGELDPAGAYTLEAAGLQVAPERGGKARVRLNGGRVLVAALSGPVRVAGGRGELLANIGAGRALEFEPQQAGAAAPARISGVLEKRGGHYFVTDETANVTIEVQGPGLEKYVGKKVRITGSTLQGVKPAGGASLVVRVATIDLVAAAAGAGAAGAGAAGAGMALGTKVIIAGVIIGGAAAGTAVAVTREEEKAPVSR